jgi:hypothetical protein
MASFALGRSASELRLSAVAIMQTLGRRCSQRRVGGLFISSLFSRPAYSSSRCRKKAYCLQLLGIATAATKLLTSAIPQVSGANGQGAAAATSKGTVLDQKGIAVVSTVAVSTLFHAVETGNAVGVGTALDRQLAQAAAALGPSYAKMVSLSL